MVYNLFMNKTAKRIYITKTTDPYINLANENRILSDAAENDTILFLWQNANTVVIGKNQNAWKECRTQLMKDDGIHLSRRPTGGGAVFHDLGNINFSFIMGNGVYNVEKQVATVISALRGLGVEAEFSGRNDIVIRGKKISGNAFMVEKNASLHHGTLLLCSDLGKLAQYLEVSKEKIISKGIDSVASRVCNIGDVHEGITRDMLFEAMSNAFIEEYGECQICDIAGLLPGAEDMHKKLSSWEWIYGHSPKFDIILEKRFDWGGLELCLMLENGMIKNIKVYSDAMDTDIIDYISHILKDVAFDTTHMANRLLEGNTAFAMNELSDIASWFKSLKM